MTIRDRIKQEVENLPESALTEVLDFIQFLKQKRRRDNLVFSTQSLSEWSFERVWDNESDAMYDKL